MNTQNSSDGRPFNLLDVAAAVVNSKGLFIKTFLLCFLLVVAAYFLVPRQYYSDGKLFVQVGRSSVGATPVTTSSQVSLQDSRETEVKTVVDLLQSRDLIEQVVDEIGAERILRPNSVIGRFFDSLPTPQLGGGGGNPSETDLTSEEIKQIKLRNKAVKQLFGKIKVDHEKNTTVVSVSAKAQTPFLAQDIVDEMLAQYQKKHVEVNSPQSTDFFDSQFKLHQDRIAKSEDELRIFRTSLGVIDVQSAQSLLQQEIAQLRLDVVSTSVKYAEAKENAKQLEMLHSKIPLFITGTDKKTSSLARDKSREALFTLQLRESELSQTYRDDNPKLRALRQAIKKAEKELNSMPQTFSESSKLVNEASPAVLIELTKARAQANALKQRLEQINLMVKGKTEKIEAMNSAWLEEAKLTRNVEIGRKEILKVAEKRAENETIRALDSESISNVKIAQKGSLIPKKSYPSGSIFLIFGSALSAFVSTVVCVLRELGRGAVATARSIIADSRSNNVPRPPVEEEPVVSPVFNEPLDPAREYITE